VRKPKIATVSTPGEQVVGQVDPAHAEAGSTNEAKPKTHALRQQPFRTVLKQKLLIKPPYECFIKPRIARQSSRH